LNIFPNIPVPGFFTTQQCTMVTFHNVKFVYRLRLLVTIQSKKKLFKDLW